MNSRLKKLEDENARLQDALEVIADAYDDIGEALEAVGFLEPSIDEEEVPYVDGVEEDDPSNLIEPEPEDSTLEQTEGEQHKDDDSGD